MYNILVGQSGGPTAAINASLYGVIQRALNTPEQIDTVYGMINGIEGFLQDQVLDLTKFASENPIGLLKTTPASFLGSCRYKLPEDLESPVYATLFEKWKAYEIRAVFYIGGNDSMDTVDKLSRYAKKMDSDIRFIGVPKTIDNDLILTDHTPGYGSTAKHVATTLREIILDAGVYVHPVVTIVELMGRNAGWVTAAGALARTPYDKNPLLIYLPEHAFDVASFLEDVRCALQQHHSVVVCVSEGISDEKGKLICEYDTDAQLDGFGHKMLAGCGKTLEQIVKREIGCKCRSIEINLPQRCSGVLASLTDVEEAEGAGQFAVQAALAGQTGKMVAFERTDAPYGISFRLVEVSEVCNREKRFPQAWITKHGTDISDEFLDYVTPLIQGENSIPFEGGLPKYLKAAYMNERLSR